MSGSPDYGKNLAEEARKAAERQRINESLAKQQQQNDGMIRGGNKS